METKDSIVEAHDAVSESVWKVGQIPPLIPVFHLSPLALRERGRG
jgi:hypothetical protein